MLGRDEGAHQRDARALVPHGVRAHLHQAPAALPAQPHLRQHALQRVEQHPVARVQPAAPEQAQEDQAPHDA